MRDVISGDVECGGVLMYDVECYMVARCGIGCDHGQMWRNDAIMQDMERHVKCGVRCGGLCQCIMWPLYVI